MKNKRQWMVYLLLLLITATALLFAGCGSDHGSGNFPQDGEHEHSFHQERQESTCTEEGFVKNVCTSCGYEEVVEYLPWAEHSGEWVQISEYDCYLGYEEERVCSVCGTTETRSVEGAHIPVTDAGKEPSCTETGLSEGSHCSVCNEVLKHQTILPANGHVMKDGVCEVCSHGVSEGLTFKYYKPAIPQTHGYAEYYFVSGIGTCTDTDIIIPYSYRGLPVLGIESGAFRGCTQLKSVTCHSDDEQQKEFYIEGAAFDGCTGITNLDLWKTKCRFAALRGLDNLACLRIGISSCYVDLDHTTFGTVFASATGDTSNEMVPKSLKTLILHGTVDIPEKCFSGCDQLVDLYIQDAPKTVGDRAFDGCTGLLAIYTEDLTKWISINFLGSRSNPLEGSNGKLYLNGEVVTDIVIPEGVERIEQGVFCGSDTLKSVVIPKGVKYIGDHAFDCHSLERIELPEGITYIGSSALSSYSLQHITLPNGIKYIGASIISRFAPVSDSSDVVWENGCMYVNGYLLAANKEELPTHLTIKDGTTVIADATFIHCGNIIEVTIPGSVKRIGECAFENCFSLQVVHFSEGLEEIGKRAFYSCQSLLPELILPDSVTTIESFAFDSHTSTSIHEATLGSGVKQIGSDIFGPFGGTTIYYNGTEEEWAQVSLAKDWRGTGEDRETPPIFKK